MKKRLKISLILIITLLMGMAIGFLISGRVISQRIEKMRNHFSETGFGREIMHVIQPTQEQREKIEPVFRDFAGKNRELMDSYHENQKEVYEELKEELSEILNEEQINKLDNHWSRRKMMMDKGRKHKRRGR